MSRSQTLYRSSRDDGRVLPDLVPGRRWDDVLLPPGLAVGLLVAGLALHQVWGHGWFVVVFPAVFASAGVGLGCATWARFARPRDPVLRGFVSAAVAWGFWSVALSIIIGPGGLSGGGAWWLSIQFAADVILIVGVNIPRARAVKGEGHEQRGASDPMEALGLHPATRGRLVSADDRTVTAAVEHGGTQSTKDLQAALPAIEAARRLRPGALRAVPGPVQGTSVVSLTPDDVLGAGPIPPPPLVPRSTVEDPIVVGLYEDGVEAVELVPHGHAVSMGMTGAGKGVAECWTLANLAVTPDVVIWLSSPVKGWQTYRPIRSAVDWFAGTRAESVAMLRALNRVVIPARTQSLDSLGYRKWEPECWTKHRVPYLVVEFEEAAWMIDREELVEISEQSRSAGIRVRFDLQRASHDRMNTSVRSNLGTVRCFGVQGSGDAEFVMPDSALEAGADPARWGVSMPGCFYLAGPGIPSARWPVPVRAFYPMDAAGREDWTAVQSAVDAYRGRAVLDETTVRAAGKAYADWKRTDGSSARPPSAVRSSASSVHGSRPQADGADETRTDEADGRGRDGGREADGETDGPADDELDEIDKYGGYEPDEPLDEETAKVDPRAPLPGWSGEDITFGLDGTPGPTPTREEMTEAFRAIIAGWVAEGRTEFTTDDLLTEWLARPGFTLSQRPALYRRITALIDAGQAERTGRGSYLLLAGAGREAVTVTDGDDGEDDED
jgi:hypothetical protein